MTARAAGAGAGLLATPGINTGGGGLTPGPRSGGREVTTVSSGVSLHRAFSLTNL